MDEDELPDSTACEVGKVTGDVISIIGSQYEMEAGAAMEPIGGFVDLQGGGLGSILGGLAINAAGVAVATDGIVNAYRSTNSLADDLYSLMSGNGGDGGSNPNEGEFETSQLTRSQQKAVTAADNIINDHLTEDDFSGTLRDLQGDPVPKQSGGYWNHLQEMKDSYVGLKRAQSTLEGSLKNPNLSVDSREFLQSKYGTATAYLQRIEELFKPYGGIN
jgi:hypothetical protein